MKKSHPRRSLVIGAEGGEMEYYGGKEGLIEDRQMDYEGRGNSSNDHSLNELMLTRNILLAHLFAAKLVPSEVVRYARRYTTVTHWEELLCAVFNPNASSLMAVVGIRQADGYSGILRKHGSIEYVRFFVDWRDGMEMQAVGLSHFRVCDNIDEGIKRTLPSYHLVSCHFDAGRYNRLLNEGVQPKLRAVLSWNHVPDMDDGFTPVFGNQVDSQISIDSQQELVSLFTTAEDPSAGMTPNPGYLPSSIVEAGLQ
ncbi:MAG: hypothetical protein AB2531_04095 [Candidatus Thiodiazotropha sp.]